VVWDEVHYERFAGAYFTGNYYLDVHPPLGKLLLAGAAKLLGVSGTVLANAQPAPLLRALPALAGALMIPLAYLLLRELGGGRRTATFGALLLLVDNAMLVESRLILPDMLLLFSGMCAALAYACARRRTGAARGWWLAGAAAAAGIALSIKWTGLSALGLVGVVWAVESWRDRRGEWRTLAREAAMLAVIPVAIYVSAFAVHFALLPHGRSSADPIMSDETRAMLNDRPIGESAPREPFVKSFADLNRQMQAINEGWATSQHPAASKWYTWPIAKHSVSYFNESDAAAGTERWIILFGNPVVWWGVLFGALAVVAASVRGARALAPRRAVLAALGAGYLLNFLPFAFIHRPMFLYHYFFALVYSVLFVAVGIGALAGWDGDDEEFWRFPSAMSLRLFGGVAGAATILFLYLIPFSYGWPLSAQGVLHRRWILERHIGVTQDR
jgi:dolichyl-phosphate-mannose-protein mannosyltransferase